MPLSDLHRAFIASIYMVNTYVCLLLHVYRLLDVKAWSKTRIVKVNELASKNKKDSSTFISGVSSIAPHSSYVGDSPSIGVGNDDRKLKRCTIHTLIRVLKFVPLMFVHFCGSRSLLSIGSFQ